MKLHLPHPLRAMFPAMFSAVLAAMLAFGCGRVGSDDVPDAMILVDAGVSDATEPPLGYTVRSTWLLRGETPTEALCTTDRIARVRLRIVDAEAVILDEIISPCAAGAFEGTTVLPWGTRHYGAWTALAPDGEELQTIPVSMPITRAMPHTTLDVVPASFEVRPASWHDYGVGGYVSVAGWPDPDTCTNANIDRLRLTLTPTSGAAEVVSATEPCGEGRLFLRTEPMLDYDVEYAILWEGLDASGGVVAMTPIDPVRATAPVRALFGLDASLTPAAP